MEKYREFLKTKIWENFQMDSTDQSKGIEHPPLQKKYPPGSPLIDLVPPSKFTSGKMPLVEAIKKRKSHRKFTDQSLSFEELSYLVWAAQGVHEVWRQGIATRRTVPSGGSRHPFETYLAVHKVNDIEAGLYRYLPIDHKLYRIPTEGDLMEQIGIAARNQKFVGKCAVTFIWTVIPYRSEWRYDKTSHKTMTLDAGHMCQNLYLACESINAGTCAIGAYSQDKMDQLLGVDGKEEFTIYVAPVGKIG